MKYNLPNRKSQIHVFKTKLGKLAPYPIDTKSKDGLTNESSASASAGGTTSATAIHRNLFREFFGPSFSKTLMSVSNE